MSANEGATVADDAVQARQTVQVFGTEVTIDRIKINITAIGEGFTVVAQVILDDEDVLVAATVSANTCTWEYASTDMVQAATRELTDWIEANA